MGIMSDILENVIMSTFAFKKIISIVIVSSNSRWIYMDYEL